MKYMILTYGSQQDYDAMAGRTTDDPALSAADFAPMHVRPIADSRAELDI